MTGRASAVCTAPIAKKVLVDHADFQYPGHTESLAALGGVERSVMMLAAGKGTVLDLHIQGDDEDAALEALETLIANRFDEAE